MLSALQRQYEILTILFERRFETAPNLAFEFSVCKNTIYNDIGLLSLSFPIYTIQGNGGGIFVMDGAKLGRKYLTEKQMSLLTKLMSQLTGDELQVMQSILRTFSVKNSQKEE